MSDLPRDLLDVLPADTAKSWVILRDQIPDSMVLYGGTAITAHLHHRVSRDLDFFFDDPGVDLQKLAADLDGLRPLAVALQTEDTLNAVFGDTKVQFLSMKGQYPVEDDVLVAGLRVASMRDLAATKLKVIGDGGELRDYFDLMVIEEQTSLSAEASLLDYQQRYKTDDMNTLHHIVRGLGHLGDVGNDPTLPIDRGAIEDYWHARQPVIFDNMDSTGTVTPPRHFDPAKLQATSSDTQTGKIWVPDHTRGGKFVRGHWRN